MGIRRSRSAGHSHPSSGAALQRLLDRDQQYVSPSYTRLYPLVVERGSGAVIEDVDGNLFLDFTAGIAVTATGHCHPKVVAAIQDQAAKLIHMSGTDFYYQPQIDLAERLAKAAPGKSAKRVFFTNSGAEALEAALKLARWHTGRTRAIAFLGRLSWPHLWGHVAVRIEAGASPRLRSAGARHSSRALSSRPGSCGTIPLPDGAAYVKSKKPYSPESLRRKKWPRFSSSRSKAKAATTYRRRISCPLCANSATGTACCLVADEVQMRHGPHGKTVCCEHWNVEPDILCLAKGIASGMPLGAILARADIMDWPSGSHASTFGGNPVSCRAALATLELLEQGYMHNATQQGARLHEGLLELKRRHSLVGDVRGLGLMRAMDLLDPAQGNAANPLLRDRMVQMAFEHGLLLLGCGKNAIRFCPPLCVTAAQVDAGLQILDQLLASTESHPAIAS